MSIFSGVNNPGLDFLQLTSTEITTIQQLSALSNPGANTIVGWDNTDMAFKNFTIGSGLTYTHSTHTLSSSGGSGGSLTVGTTTIASGTNTYIEYNNAGVLGEYSISGTGSVAMTNSPTFVSPNIDSATASSINGQQINSATIYYFTYFV